MSVGNEDLSQILQPGEINPTSTRQSKISYSRKFLLSLSNLEICKRLPEGFNESLLSDFGSSPLQGFRRNDYSSSSPEKGETGNFSRGVDRWDSRASGRNDNDSHSDRDSDSGRRYGTHFRRPWQNPEHDGLLGSGSLPRPPGFRAGAPVPNSRANDQPLKKKSSDPYHPPRPYKAAPHSRRETKDSYNDETFGWGENTSEGRSEEEIKRRAEFEMMRKEQHKELQQKMKLKVDKLKDDPMTELASSLDDGAEIVITNESDSSVIKTLQQNESGKSSVSSQDHQIRPLVPPGFANAAAVDKFSGPKSLEAGKLELGHENKDERPTPIGLGYNNCEITSSFATKGGIKGLPPSLLELSSKTTSSDNHSFKASNISEISDVLRSGNVGIGPENLNGLNVMSEAGHSTSILEKLFGGALSLSSSSPPNTIEDQNMKSDDAWSPKDSQFQTSKFVHLFLEEGSDKSSLLASETEPAEKTLTLLSNLMKLTTSTPNDAGISEVLCINNKAETFPAFLTCEDLEHSILSNVGESSSNARPPQICIEHGIDNEIKKADIDKNASHHLLSLLQMGTSVNSKSMPMISMLDKVFPTEPKILGNLRDEGEENIDSGKGLTLETLFGTAFMEELKSADVPVPSLRNSSLPSYLDVSEPSMPPLVVSDDKAVTSNATSKRVYKEDYILQLGGKHQTNLDEEVEVNWLNFGGPQTEMGSPNSASYCTRLPKEDSSTSNAQMFPSSSSAAANIAEKLTALGGSIRGERSTVHRQVLDPIMNAQSSPQFNSGPMNHGTPMFHHLDPHPAVSIDPQFNVMAHGGIPHQNARIHHQFPANVGHASYGHSGSGLSEFDHLIHPMLQQPHIPNNNLLPPHPGGNLPGYIQDHNLIHGFLFGRHQPNHGMRLGAEHGDTVNEPPPQVLQRILEMELRSGQKPIHHPGSGHSWPVYEHELDADLWYS